MPRRSKPSVWTETGCLEWQNARMPKGYGVHDRPEGGTRLVHRQVMEAHLGRRLDPSETVMHTCDNPPCHNVDHLRLGDLVRNNQDMWQKGRGRNAQMLRTACGRCGQPYGSYTSPVTGETRRRCWPCYEKSQIADKLRRRAKTISDGKTPRPNSWKQD